MAFKIYERLRDPWGDLEARLLLAQVALAKGDDGADSLVAACDGAVLDEAEPRQHRHLTRAWLAQRRGRWADAAAEIDAARGAFLVGGPDGEPRTPRGRTAKALASAEAASRTGDHTPHLLTRLSRLEWIGPALGKIELWLAEVGPNAKAPRRVARQI
jgi:hypothetical protein